MKHKNGFTLVELLVVIAIIGILIALLLPAVQAAREAARNLQCKNHLKQMGTASMVHENTHGFFPSGGWSCRWIGDPDRGMGEDQPGSWFYSILPYMELQALFDLPSDGDPGTIKVAQLIGSRTLVETPVATFNCPSRRAAKLYPDAGWLWAHNMQQPKSGARADYGGNAGEYDVTGNSGTIAPYGNSELQKVDNGTYAWTQPNNINGHASDNGVIYRLSEVKIRDISDGTSTTYLAGEKYLAPDAYETGTDSSDNETLYSGYDRDTILFTKNQATCQPMQDQEGFFNMLGFGSAHAGGFNVVFCDGSVRSQNYNIDLLLNRRLGVRNDGEIIVENE